MDEEERHTHIRRGIAAHGALRTWRQLDQEFKLQKRTNPHVSNITKTDRDWVGREYGDELHRARVRER